MIDLLEHEGVGDNLRFLILEVERQVGRVADYINSRDPVVARQLFARDDYIDQLKRTIERKCFDLATGQEEHHVHLLKALDIVNANLERIADFCEDIVGHIQHLDALDGVTSCDFQPFVAQVRLGLSHIENAIYRQDVKLALEICETEKTLDRLYAEALRDAQRELGTGEHAEVHVTTIFVAHYFERMGDSLLNVGEAIMSALLGERVKMPQIHALENLFESVKEHGDLASLSLEDVGETRSGCRIARVSEGAGSRMVIFKEGKLAKLIQEKARIDHLETVMPGVAPSIYSFSDHGESGAILYEYLPGNTFEELILQPDETRLELALEGIAQTMTSMWNKTRVAEPASPLFVKQLSDRLPDLFTVHPQFCQRQARFGGVTFPSLTETVRRLRPLDECLTVPFSVLIHGDFNVDNIICGPGDKDIRLIDVHRSRMMDYVQDISVFLVSCQRLQVFAAPVRRRIRYASRWMYRFGKSLAQQWQDDTYDIRLAIGLARSLATSTRFILDQELSMAMFLRAEYILHRLVAHDFSRPQDYVIDEEVLVD